MNKPKHSQCSNWQPNASITTLRLRAEVLAKIRAFFATRKILEVETPLLASSAIPDPNIHSLTTKYQSPMAQKKQTLYLQTSPEFAMKRLLAAGSGSIYQICKAFRDKECGTLHQPEFTLLEWYRVGFNLTALMDETDEFLNFILQTKKAERITYRALFQKHLSIDPLLANTSELKKCALKKGFTPSAELAKSPDKDTWLNALLCHFIEPHLGKNRPTFIYDFPASQAALARIRPENPPVAERFEVYINGIELANGFHELKDAKEQQQRFLKDLIKRKALGLPQVKPDNNLLAALEHGLPDCSGVALGLDRLMMLVTKSALIKEVISFTVA